MAQKNRETVIVTGGAGFIGSHVCDELLKQGYRVICIDNLNSYYSPLKKLNNIEHNKQNPNFHFLAMDIQDKEQVEQVFQQNRIDKIIHLAARAGVRPSIENPLLYRDANVNGTINLLTLAEKYNVKNFVFASSSSIYGKNKKIPFSETDNVDYPISPYAASKKACELFCYTYSYLYGLNITCLRFFTVYGPRGRPDMAPYLFTKKISEGETVKMFGDGTTKRDYTYISDIVGGVISALEKNFKFEIINLGNNKPIELRQFISVIERNLGKNAKIKREKLPQGDVPITYADIGKAKRLLNYEPVIGIEEGMKKFIEWYLEENR